VKKKPTSSTTFLFKCVAGWYSSHIYAILVPIFPNTPLNVTPHLSRAKVMNLSMKHLVRNLGGICDRSLINIFNESIFNMLMTKKTILKMIEQLLETSTNLFGSWSWQAYEPLSPSAYIQS